MATLYKPYFWLKFATTNQSQLKFRVDIPTGTTLPASPSVGNDYSTYTRTLTYQLTGTPGSGSAPVERSHHLNPSTGYDPALCYIKIVIIDSSSNPVGISTANQSEADASGDDHHIGRLA